MDKSSFDPDKPHKTKSGYQVISVKLTKKLMGIVKYDDEYAIFCVWTLDGEKINIFPRNSEGHDLDLINL